ncbi:hypothetical protein DZA50_05285 [Kangiella sp. HD9-110m-PIT-SAG07]|nr:hypothetical protein DZA50_05285 [Kangiella sp. HD9-110m-PIT-SAG07]
MFKQLEQFCSSLKGAQFDLKWDSERTYCIAEKMFVVFCPKSSDHKGATSICFKVSPADFVALTDIEGIIPAPYLARYHWISVERESVLSPKQLEELVKGSYDMIFSKLTKKKQQAILNKTP